MSLKPLWMALGGLAAGAVLTFAAGVGGLAAALLFGLVAAYLLYRRPPGQPTTHERFFGDAAEDTRLTELPPDERRGR
jgi:hypothetical protein